MQNKVSPLSDYRGVESCWLSFDTEALTKLYRSPRFRRLYLFGLDP